MGRRRRRHRVQNVVHAHINMYVSIMFAVHVRQKLLWRQFRACETETKQTNCHCQIQSVCIRIEIRNSATPPNDSATKQQEKWQHFCAKLKQCSNSCCDAIGTEITELIEVRCVFRCCVCVCVHAFS